MRAVCAGIVPVSSARLQEARNRLDSLTKPVGSLGRLEELARRLYAIQEQMILKVKPARMFTIAGDHGVTDEGVAFAPRAVTRLMVENFLRGGAAINSLCRVAGVDLLVVDAGVAGRPFPAHPVLRNARIAPGTANMAKGPAMSLAECLAALELGISLANEAWAAGFRTLGTGEMGIGNTTPSSALFCAWLGLAPDEATGPGAGTPFLGLGHKASVIGRALEANAGALREDDPVAVLAALGGLEIAALAGLILGGAARRMAVMIDGFIATAAYTAAWKIAPDVRGYCFFSHGSAEAAHGAVLERLGEKPLLDLEMRLGEGTGAALGIMLMEAAAGVFNGMATFEEAGIGLA